MIVHDSSRRPLGAVATSSVSAPGSTRTQTSTHRAVNSSDKFFSVASKVLGPLLLATLSIVWFFPVRDGVFGFDDPGVILHQSDTQASLLDRTILDVNANRWRPVFSTLFKVLTIAFGENYTAYFWFNVALTLALVLLVYLIVLRLSTSTVTATIMAITVLTSRFAYYQVTQVIGGPLEALSLIFLLLLVGSLIEFERSGRAVYLGWSVFLYTLIIHTHERYSVIILFLVSLVITSHYLTIRTKAFWCSVLAAPLVLSIAVRVYVLDLPLLVGTGSSTELGFTWRTGVGHYVLSILNIFGINSGPEYLQGLAFQVLSPPYKYASVGLAILSLICVGGGFLARAKGRQNWLTALGARRNILLGLLLVLVLVLSFSVTIRVEPRWVYAPFIVIVLIIARNLSLLAGNPRMKGLRVLALIAFLMLSVILDKKYAENIGGVYFMGARAEALTIVEETIGRHGDVLVSRPIYVIDQTAGADWQARLDPLILANSDLDPPTVTTVSSLADIPADGRYLIYDTAGGFHEFEYPASGFLLTGEVHLDGWVGKHFEMRGECANVAVVIRPFRAGPDRYVTISGLGETAIRYPLTQPEVRLSLAGAQVENGFDAVFDRAFVPSDEGAGADVRSLAASVAVTCVRTAGE